MEDPWGSRGLTAFGRPGESFITSARTYAYRRQGDHKEFCKGGYSGGYTPGHMGTKHGYQTLSYWPYPGIYPVCTRVFTCVQQEINSGTKGTKRGYSDHTRVNTYPDTYRSGVYMANTRVHTIRG